MTEEEYEAELEREAQLRAEATAAGDVKEDGDILSVEEQERIKAKVASFAPWMTVDPEVHRRSRSHTCYEATTRRACACRAQAIAKAKKARDERKAKATAVDAMRIDPQARLRWAAKKHATRVL